LELRRWLRILATVAFVSKHIRCCDPKNLPTLIAGGSNIGLRHGTYWRSKDARKSNVYLSILRSMKIEEGSFSDSTGTVSDSIFSAV